MKNEKKFTDKYLIKEDDNIQTKVGLADIDNFNNTFT